MSLAKALPRPCPTCGEISGGVFCPQDGSPLAGSFTIGGDRYVVDELIGSGATAILFGGHHRSLSRPVAVKVLRPEVARNEEQQQRFLREARSASRLSHENIVGVLDFGWDDELGVTYMVMERLHGDTLAGELTQHGPMAWRDAVQVLVQLGRGLTAAHALGIVHRDLSPRNVMLVQAAGRRVAKLCDFGLSRHSEGGDRVTHNGVWVGTPSYMAPEQADDAALAPAADLYSLGVLAYELVTGHLPVEGDSVADVMAAKLSDDPVPVSVRFPELAIPEELDALISRCLQREPAQRPSAAELERILVRLEARATSLGGGGVGAASPAGSTPAISVPRTLTPALPPLEDGSPSMIGSYRVVRSLGTGGTGRVYLGEHPLIGTKVAIKVLLPEIAGSAETVKRFIQEARSSSQIDSPHIPRYYDFGRTAGGLPYAVMEYFEGQTLAEYIEKVGALSVEETAGILSQVAGALLLAHKAGLVHRDLKPENLFLVAAETPTASDGMPGRAVTAAGSSPTLFHSAFSVKVLDFGIAKSFDKESGTRTQQGFFLGTPFYCAPEQVFGAEVDPRADVYALGVTAFEMLTGMPPFVGEISEVLESKTSREAPLLRGERPELPEFVERTVARMLARDLSARAESMSWVREQLELWGQPAAEQAAAEASMQRRLARAASVVALRASSSGEAAAARDEAALAQGDSAALDALVSSSFRKLRAQSSDGLTPVEIAALTGPQPVASQPVHARGAHPTFDADFDVLETASLAPGSRPMIPIPAPAIPLWRRPLVLLLAVAGLAGVAAVGLSLGSGASGEAKAPVVTPIDSHGPKVSPLQAQSGAVVSSSPAAGGAEDPGKGGGPGASEPAAATPAPPVEDPSESVDPAEEPSRKGHRPGRKKKSGGARREDKPGTPSVKPSEPDPPKDVKLVDPFAN